MATTFYGVRVLDVDHRESVLVLRTVVTHLDPARRSHEPPPEDPSFFWRFLDRYGAYNASLGEDARLGEHWVDQNAWRFVASVEELSRHRHPLKDWDGIRAFYHLQDGRWPDEDRLPVADYRVRLRPGCDLSQIAVGMTVDTAAWPTAADRLRPEEAHELPDPSQPIFQYPAFPGRERDASTVSRLQFSPDGRHLLMQSIEGRLRVVGASDGELVAEHAGEPWSVDSAGWLSDGRVAWLEDRTGHTWDPTTGALGKLTSYGTFGSRDGCRFVVRDGWTRTLLRTADGEVLHSVEHDDSAMVWAAFATAGRAMAWAVEDDTVRWRALHPTQSEEHDLRMRNVNDLALSPDGRFVLFAQSHLAQVRRASDGAMVRHLFDGQEYVTGIDWCSTGRHVAVGIANREGFHTCIRVYGMGRPTQ